MKKIKKAKKIKLVEKLFPTFISSIPHHKDILRTITKYTFFAAVIGFLFLNIFLSQLISPIFFRMTNNDRKDFTDYLESIRDLPQFSSELLRLKNIYGNAIENAVYSKETEEEKMIQNYEQILGKNLYARDILYSLFLLYEQKGDKKIAQEYFQRATAVDPMIK